MSLKEISDRPTKLKRKDTKAELLKTTSTNTSDMYQKVNEYEERMAAISYDSDDTFIILCDQFGDIVDEITELKLNSRQEEVSEKQNVASLLFILLKKYNRFEKLKLNSNREKLNETKRQVDSSHLQLQNLMYEIYHLKKEVSKCLQFVSRNDPIELISVDEFYKEAPAALSRPEVTREDEHQLKLARLEWELQQRQVLAEKYRILEEQKRSVTSDTNEKQICNNNLGPMIKKMLKVTKPVQQHLNLSSSQLQSEPELAYLLPHPLYFLCVQVEAMHEACDPLLEVKIMGSKEESEQFKAVSIDTVALEEDSDSDGESKVRHRSKSHVQSKEEKINNLFVKHPLSVVINVFLKDRRYISIVFVYYVNLEIVAIFPTVNVPNPYTGISCRDLLNSFTVLDALYPGDYGDQSPNPTNHYKFKQLGVEFDKNQHGCSYMWVQHLCGVTYPFTTSSTANVEKCTISTIQAIRKRLKLRLDLCYQMNHIERTMLLLDLPMVKPFISVKVNSKLVKWEALSWESYRELAYVSPILDENLVSDRDYFFKLIFMNGPAYLTAAVTLKSDYPATSPIYSLQLLNNNIIKDSTNDSNVRDIERELNVHYEEFADSLKKPVFLLMAQLIQLSISLDIYLECTDPVNYPKEKLFLKSFRTRIRSLPLKYVHYIQEGIFIQR